MDDETRIIVNALNEQIRIKKRELDILSKEIDKLISKE